MPTALGRFLAVLGGWGAAVSSVDPAGVSLPSPPPHPTVSDGISFSPGWARKPQNLSGPHVSLMYLGSQSVLSWS